MLPPCLLYTSCAACLQPFEARKGTRRRHHFAHVSNYECMYASEVAIYKAIAEALKQSGFLTLPPVMLRFPAWHDPELLQEARRLKIDSVAFECEPLSYPPLLRVTMQGTPLRILLDFDRYYDNDDRVELAEEAKVEDYSVSYTHLDVYKRQVLYRVTPIFEGNNLLANGVLMEGYSVEDKGAGVSYCVFAYNVQPGIEIDYATGESKLADGAQQEEQKTATVTPTPSPEPEKQEPVTRSDASQADYIPVSYTHLARA